MGINLKEALRKELKADQGQTFKFESVGDQLIFTFKSRITVPTQRGEDSDLVRVTVLAGEKIVSGKVTSVEPGDHSFFLGTHLTDLFKRKAPGAGDTIRIKLAEIQTENRGFKKFGFEFLEKVSTAPTPPKPSKPEPSDDDVPF